VFLVGLAGLQAVEQAAKGSVEQIAECGGMPVTAVFAPVVVSAGARGCGDGSERPHVSDGGYPLVLHPAAGDMDAASAGAGDGCRAGVCLQRSSVREPGAVIAEFAEFAE
jgi:hypothetical protein